MKEKLREFLRPRLAVLLAAALLAAYLPAMPAARADGVAPTSAWEDQDGVRDEHFVENPTKLASYTYSNSKGEAENVTVNHSFPLGSKENPISIPDETALIRFGKLGRDSTEGKYFILDKSGGQYDMGAHTMLPLMGDATSSSGMPAPSAPFLGVLIGNGASIENVCINTESTVFGLFGTIGGGEDAEGVEVTDLTVSLTSVSSAESSIITAGGLVGFVRDGATLTNCTANVTGNLGGEYVGGLVGYVRDGATLTNCTANVTGNLTADGSGAAGGLVGGVLRGATLTNCTANVTGDLGGEYAGGLVGYVRDGVTLTNCTANVTGDLGGEYVGGLVGGVDWDRAVALTNCTAKVAGSLTEDNYAGGLVGYIGWDSTMTLTNCAAKVEDSLTADSYAGGLVGYVGRDSTMTLTNCAAKVEGSLAADSYAGGLVGYVDSGTVTLADCTAQAVITKPESGSCAPSGPVGEGTATFSGANVTTLQMGADSDVFLALMNGTTLTLDDSGVLTATDAASGNETTGSVEVTSNGGAVIQVHGGDATYTLTGVNGTIRLEDKNPAEYWVTLDASFSSDDADPLAKGDKVDLLGEADNRLCTVAVKAGTGGSASVSNGEPVSVGTEVTVKATPENGYRFVNWTEDGQQVSTGASYTFIVTSSRTLTAVFERTSSGGGSSGGGGGGTYTPPKKDEPQTGSSGGWKDIQKELENTKPGDNVDVDMNGATEVPREVLEGIAGKDVEVSFDMGGGIVWTVNGQDIPAGIGSLNLGIKTGSSSIPVNVVNAITGEKSTMQFTLAHSGPFGTVLHLSLNLGATNRGYWANLYWFDEGGKELVFRHSCRIDSEGKASWPFDHASSYAVVIDEKNHDPAWENPFADVSEGAWYYEAVRFVCDTKLQLKH